MTFPIPCSELYDWLPHRPPMVWVDEVISADGVSGECAVNVKSDALYMSDGFLRPSSAVEFLAQAFGYANAAFAVSSGTTAAAPKKAFLVSVTKCEMSTELVRPGMRLAVKIFNIKPVGPILLFDGEVVDSNSHVVCRASLKVYSE
ncbi:MAG: hypothetical protein V4692_10195 [Bdellovibrionota bacterium]